MSSNIFQECQKVKTFLEKNIFRFYGCPGQVNFLEISCLFLGKVKFELDFSFFQFAFFSLLRILALDKLCRKTTQHFEGATKYERETRRSGAEPKLYIPSTLSTHIDIVIFSWQIRPSRQYSKFLQFCLKLL